MAAHVNVTFPPSSAVVLAGGTVIIGGDNFLDSEVVGLSLSDTTTVNVTEAKKKIANKCGIRTIINKYTQVNIIEKRYFNFNLKV